MKIIKKEFERFFKKRIKNYWQNLTIENRKKFLLETFNMYNPLTYLEEEFYKKQPTEEEIINLKKDLDKESVEIIDLFIKRIYSPVSKSWFLNKKDFYSENELINQDVFYDIKTNFGELKYNPEFEKFKLFNFFESVYRYHSGLPFLPENILNELKNTDFIDGGAYIGDSAFVFLDNYKPSCIYSFEPCRENFDFLVKNIADKNCGDKIKPVNLGLSDTKQTISASGGFGAGFSINSNEDNNSEQNIELTTIDDFVQENNLTVGLIKLDVEGHEWRTINGAINTIKNQKPVLLISIYHTPKDFFEIKPFIESLNLNYKFKIRKLLNSHPIYDTMLICY